MALVFALAALGCGEAPQQAAEAAPPVSGAGHTLYLTWCQACHGTTGVGDGPAAPALRTPPADLTRLWERYGVPLDRERLGRYIDGRQLVGAHDPREMPVWGEEFFADLAELPREPSAESAKQRLVEVLIEHLETLQSRQGA